MRISITLSLFILLMAGCGSDYGHKKSNKTLHDNQFILEGNFISGGGRLLFYEEISAESFIPLDTIRTDENGSISVVLSIGKTAFYALKNEHGDYIILFPLASDSIHIISDYNDLSTYQLSGSRDSEAISALHKETRFFMDKINEIMRITRDSMISDHYPALKVELNKQYDSLIQNFKKYSLEFISENKKSPVSLLALFNQIGRGVYVFDPLNDFEVYAEVDSMLFTSYPDFPAVKELHNKLHVIKSKK